MSILTARTIWQVPRQPVTYSQNSKFKRIAGLPCYLVTLRYSKIVTCCLGIRKIVLAVEMLMHPFQKLLQNVTKLEGGGISDCTTLYTKTNSSVTLRNERTHPNIQLVLGAIFKP